MKLKPIIFITVTQNQLEEAFTEWERRYRENPEEFMSEAERLLKLNPKTYGEATAPYLIQILVNMGLTTNHG